MSSPNLNYRYYNWEVDDDLPYTGVLGLDPETGHIYDEDGDVVDAATLEAFCDGDGNVVDAATLEAFCDGDGKGDDEDE